MAESAMGYFKIGAAVAAGFFGAKLLLDGAVAIGTVAGKRWAQTQETCVTFPDSEMVFRIHCGKDGAMDLFYDPSTGCQYMRYKEEALVPRLGNDGKPHCKKTFGTTDKDAEDGDTDVKKETPL